MRKTTQAVLFTALVASLFAGERLKVRIIARQDSNSVYGYVIPGYSQTTANSRAGCAGTGTATPGPGGTTTATATANCAGQTTATTTGRPAVAGSYSVSGATYTLRLPDGRLAVVNCDSKINWAGHGRRSCRKPLVEDIEAEFSGDAAKLMWPVSIDGKKTQSETYRVLGVIGPKPTEDRQ